MGPSAERRSYLSIREVLDLLVEEFSDITISKIRFLESRGLIHPERTPSGYRKFFETDVERLRWILRQQRENFLPLKVIKGRLDGDVASTEAVVAEQLFSSDVGEADSVVGFQSSARDPLSLGGSEASRRGHSTVAVVDRTTKTMLEAPAEVLEPTGSIAPTEQIAPTESTEHNRPEHSRPEHNRPEHNRQSEVSDIEDVLTIEPATSVESTDNGPQEVTDAEGSVAEKNLVRGTCQRELSTRPLVSHSENSTTYTVDELVKVSGADVALIVELQEFGLIESHTVAGVTCFDDIAAEIVRCAVQFARFGLEPRHLNAMHHAAEREAGLYATVVTPLVRQRNPEARARATRDLDQLTVLGGAWREAFIRAELRRLTGG